MDFYQIFIKAFHERTAHICIFAANIDEKVYGANNAYIFSRICPHSLNVAALVPLGQAARLEETAVFGYISIQHYTITITTLRDLSLFKPSSPSRPSPLLASASLSGDPFPLFHAEVSIFVRDLVLGLPTHSAIHQPFDAVVPLQNSPAECPGADHVRSRRREQPRLFGAPQAATARGGGGQERLTGRRRRRRRQAAVAGRAEGPAASVDGEGGRESGTKSEPASSAGGSSRRRWVFSDTQSESRLRDADVPRTS